MASHRKSRTPILPTVRRGAAVCAAIPALAITLGGGIAAADTGNTGGQTAPCHGDAVCAPINVGANIPDVLHDGIGVLDAVHLHH